MQTTTIKSIEVKKLYGKKSFIVDLDNRPLRIIHGQNGIGKTSLLKAVDAICSEDEQTLQSLNCEEVEVVTNMGSVKWVKNEGITKSNNKQEESETDSRIWLVDLGSATGAFEALVELMGLEEFKWDKRRAKETSKELETLSRSSGIPLDGSQALLREIEGPCVRLSEIQLRGLVKKALGIVERDDILDSPLAARRRDRATSEGESVGLWRASRLLRHKGVSPTQELVEFFSALVPDPRSFLQVGGPDPITFGRYIGQRLMSKHGRMSVQDYAKVKSPCIRIATNRLRGELNFKNGERLEWYEENAELQSMRERREYNSFRRSRRPDSAAQTGYCADLCIEAFNSHIKDLLTKAREKAASLESTYIKRLTQKNTHEQLNQEIIEQVKELHRDLSNVGIVDQTDLELDGLHDIREHKVAIRQWIEDLREQYESIDQIDVKKLTLFIEVLQKYLSGKIVGIDAQDRKLRISERSDSEQSSNLKPKHLSSGEQHIIVMCFSYIFKPEHASVCMIDEPELSLNSSWQRDLVETLISIDKRLSRETQLILATHSPQIVSEHIDELIEISPINDSSADSYQSDQ